MIMKSYPHYNFDTSVERVFKAEGGYSNHPGDRGGETNYGITKATALVNRSLWVKFNWDGNMKTMPKDFAKAVYKKAYWDKIKGDELLKIHPLLADHMFDVAVNSGPGTPVKHLQEALNLLNERQVAYKDIAVDGALGPGTLNSLRAYAKRRGEEGLENLVLCMVALQMRLHLAISAKNETQETFTNGWIARDSRKMRSYVLAMDGDKRAPA